MKRKIHPSIVLFFLFFIIFSVAVVLTFFPYREEDKIPNSYVRFSEEYLLSYGSESQETISLPTKLKLNQATNEVSLSVYPKLYMYSGGNLFFKTQNLGVQIDNCGNVIYSYHYDDDKRQDEYGVKWHFIPLNADYFDKKITISFFCPHETASFRLPAIYYTRQNTAIQSTAIASLTPILIAFFILVTGITTVLFGVLNISVRQYIWYAMFCLSTFLWIFAETPLVQILFDQAHFFFKMKIVSYVFLIYFLFLHIFQMANFKNRTVLFASSVVALIYTAVMLILPVYHAIPMMFVPLLLFPLVVGLLVCAICLILKIYSKHTTLRYVYIIISILAAALLMLETVLKVISMYDSDLISHLITLFTLFPLTVSIKRFTCKAQSAITNEKLLQAIAFTDSLTHTYNRAAFNRDMRELEQRQDKSKIAVAIFDINDLKRVNDTCGHSVGDELIRSAANAITHSFSDAGRCYRIGGDEFAVILKDYDGKKTLIFRQKLEENLRNQNCRCDKFSLSLAWSLDFYREGIDRSLDDLHRRVDAKMYLEKNKMKGKGAPPSAQGGAVYEP